MEQKENIGVNIALVINILVGCSSLSFCFFSFLVFYLWCFENLEVSMIRIKRDLSSTINDAATHSYEFI